MLETLESHHQLILIQISHCIKQHKATTFVQWEALDALVPFNLTISKVVLELK